LILSIDDTINLASKLSPRKVFNGLKLLSGYYLSRLTKKDMQWGKPISISIEPTTSCNLRCPECPSGLRSFTRPTGMLTFEIFKKAIDELKHDLLYLILYFQGEPYLNRSFFEFVNYASKQNIYTSTSTNAHYLDDVNSRKTVESGLDRLIISIDGATQETYEQYRVGGSLTKVIDGTKNIVKWKKELNSKTPQLVFQFLVVKPNEHQVAEVKKLANELGVDKVAFKTAQIYDYQNGSPLIPENEKFSRYRKKNNGHYSIKNKLLNQCWKMWHSCVMTWDGKITPCCFDKDASHQFGNITDASFSEIWKNQKYSQFRRAILKSRKEIDICQNCTEGTTPFV